MREASSIRPARLSAEERAIQRLVVQHLRRYPRMAVQDLYKLLFQAAMGAEHAVVDVEAARQWLWHEWQKLGYGPEEPLIDRLSPDGRLVRLHLRPYAAARGDPAALLEALVRTAQAHQGGVHLLERYWQAAARLGTIGVLPLGAETLQQFWAAAQAGGFPPVHHSAAYAEAYRPAYRVVRHEFLMSP